jgi:hypothetical protein
MHGVDSIVAAVVVDVVAAVFLGPDAGNPARVARCGVSVSWVAYLLKPKSPFRTGIG